MRKVNNLRTVRFGLPAALLWTAALASCDLFSSGLGGKVDMDPPSLIVSSPSQNAYISGAVVVSGTASDDLALKGVSAKVTLSDGRAITREAALNADGTWSLSFPAYAADNTNGIPDGERRVEVTATDQKGRTTTNSIVIFMDTVGPTVVVNVPSAYDKTGTNKLVTSDSITVKGEAWDSSPFSKVELAILDASRNTILTKTADGTASWSVKVNYGAGKDIDLPDGSYTFVVRAYDRAGNASTRFFHVQDIWAALNAGVAASQADIDTIGKADQRGSAFPGNWASVTGSAFTAFTFLKNNQAPVAAITTPTAGSLVGGDATTAAGTATVTGARITKVLWAVKNLDAEPGAAAPADDSAWSAANLSETAGTLNWSAAIELTAKAEGSYRLFVKALDAGGSYSAVVTRDFNFDKAVPSLSETSIGVTPSYKNADFSFSGSVSDSNGLQSVHVTMDGAAVFTENLAALAPNTAHTWTYPVNVAAVAPTSAVVKEFVIVATDKAGRTNSITRRVTIDTNAPVVAFADPIPSLEPNGASLGRRRVNGTVSFRGNASDDSEITKLWLRVGDNAFTDADLQPGNYSFQKSIVTTSYTDASPLTVYVRAQDSAGNVNNSSYVMYVDQASDKPVLDFSNFDETALTPAAAGSNLLETNAELIGTVSDDDSISVATLQIAVDGGAWTALSSPPASDTTQGSFRHNLNALPEGVHYLQARVADVNGTTSLLPATGPVYFAIDRAAPAAAFNNAGVGLFVRSNADVTLTGTASDANGLKTWTDPLDSLVHQYVELSRDGGVTWVKVSVNAGAWSYTFNTGAAVSGTLPVSARATDTYNKQTIQTYTVTIDADPPTIAFTGVTPIIDPTYDVGGNLTGGKVNGTITIRGTANDANPLSSVAYKFDGDPDYTAFSGNLGSWTITKNTVTLVEDAVTTLYIRARDGAGNETISTIALTADQDTDLPIVRLVSIDPTKVNPKDNRLDSTAFALEIVDDDGIPADALQLRFSSDGGTVWSSWATVTHTAASGGIAKAVTYTLSGGAAAEGVAQLVQVRIVDVNGVAGTQITDAAKVLHASATYWVDLGAPTIDFTLLDGASYGGGTAYRRVAFALSGTVNDGSALASVQYSLDGTTWTAVGSYVNHGAWSVALTETVNGLYLRAADEFGKTTTTSRIPVSVVYDVTPPAAGITVPVSAVSTDAAYWHRGTFALSGAATDAGSGVAGVQVAVTVKGSAPVAGDWHAASLGSGTWSYSYDSSAVAEGEKTLHVIATDTAGNASADLTRDFGIDKNDPTFTGLQADAVAYTALIYRSGGSVTLSGTASDTLAISRVVVEEKAPGAGSWTTAATLAAPSATLPFAWSWIKTFNVTDTEGRYDYRIIAWDAAGNPHTASPAANLSIFFDKTPPALPAITAPNANAYFGESSASIKATAADAGPAPSGVNKVEWSPDGTTWTAMTAGTPWTAEMDLRDDAGNPYAVLRTQGLKTARVRSTDNAGNVSAETTVNFWIDRVAPEASFDSPAANIRTNGAAVFPVVLSASDFNGVAAIELKAGVNDFSSPDAAAVLNGGTGKWEGSIPAAAIYALSAGSRTIYARVRDAPGRTAVVGLPIIVDKTPPTVSFSTPASSSSINRTIAVRGAANDDQVLTRVVVEIWNQSGSVWNTVSTITGTDAYNWSVPAFDTTLYDSAAYDRDTGTAGTQIRLRATATDEAGNANAAAATLDLTIDQNSDRPVVKLSNIVPTGTSILKMTRTVYGTVSDDDGTPAAFSVSEDNSAWTPITLDGSNWSYEASAADGSKNLYFRVTDAAGTVFSTDAANEPRVQNGAGYWETFVTFRVDTVTPEIDSTISVDKAAPYDFAADANTAALTANLPFGGPTARFSIRALARDANGIASVTVNVPGIGAVAAPVFGSAVAYPGYTAYATAEIDVGALTDGAKDVTVTVTDGSGLTSTATRTILVDNTAPTLDFLTPATATVVNGEITVRGTASDALSQLDSVTYRIGRNYASDPALTPNGSSYLWEIPFTGANALSAFSNATESYVDTSTGVTLYILPIVVRATDRAGNVRESVPIDGTGARPTTTSLTAAALAGSTRVAVGQVALIGGVARVITAWTPATGTITWTGAISTAETAYSILPYSLRIDPDGDAPKAFISYPATGATLGGNVRIYGTALDDDGVTSVWMQIDTNQDGSFTAADDAIGGWYNGGSGLQTTGSSNWNTTINGSGEFNPAGASPTHLLVRVRAQDIYGTWGPWSTPIELLIDKDVPLIGSAYPLRLDPDSDPNNGNETAYSYGMYIKGNWILRGSIEDETALSSISITGDITGTLTSQPSWFTAVTAADPPHTGKYKRIDLAIPISCPADTAATWNFTITAGDVSEPARESSQALRLVVDSLAPTAALNAAASPPLVQQSNGWYKVKGTAVDTGSDINRVEVYFIRRGNGTTTFDRMYNPLTSNQSALLGTFSFSQNAPVKVGTAASRTTTSLTDASLIGNTLIAVGQKVTIGGEKRTISAWNPGAGTVTWADGAVSTSLTSYSVRLAISIDHKDIVESWGGSSVVNDDGDGYVEYLKQDSGTTYTWFVDMKSNNIPDGPIEIHYVVFDSSENATHYQTASYKIQNNGPRVAAMWLGTDLDLNLSINEAADSTERELFAFADGTTDGLSATTSFKVKEAPMYILPVVTNGNGDLTVVLSAGVNAGALTQIGSYYTLRAGEAGALVPITLNATTLDGVGEGSRVFRLVVWDTTEETTPRTDSLSLTRDITCELSRVDSVIPTAAIRPLYWNSSSDNSLYDNSRSNGHIEIAGVFDGSDPDVSGGISFRGVAYDDQRLTAIWMYIGDGTTDTGAFGFTGAATSKTIDGLTYYRVATYSGGAWTGSGSYSANGWRFDVSGGSINQGGHRADWRLDWNSAGISGAAARNRVVRVVAEDKRSGTPNPSSTATNPVAWSGTASRASAFTLTHSALIAQSVALGAPVLLGTGDSSYFTRVAAFNPATGTVTLATGVDTSQTVYRILSDADNEPSFQIDVVPYITSIATTINSLVLSDFNRSALGRYPVSGGEAVTVNGFNLAPATLSGSSSDVRLSIDPDAYDAAYTTKQGTGLTSSSASGDYSTLTVTISAAGSGYLTVIANGVPSINNVDAATSYNQESSSIHQTVYDDRFFSLWALTTLRTNAAAPNANNALYPSMVVNGTTPQFAYVNNSGGYGLAEYWNGTAETKIYENWDLFTFTSLALNDAGSRAALYDINIVQSGTNFIGDKGGITANFFFNPPNTTWSGTTYYYRDNNLWLDNLYKSGNLAVLDRYRYPDIKLVGPDAGSQAFYAVYDSIDDRVLFRYFRVGTDQTTVGGGAAGNATRVNDSGTALYVNNQDLVQRNQNGTWPVYTDNATNNTRFGQNNNSGNTNAAQTIATGAGEHVAVEGTSAGYALLVYYRTSDNALVYQYNTNPSGTTWSAPMIIDSNIGAEYIDMVVDSADRVHIAYYDSFNGDVKYVYLSAYDSASYTRVKVDSYLSVGSKLSISLNAADVPYITYRGVGNTAKIAWLSGSLGNGVDSSDKFNGTWEVQVLPQRIIDSDSNRFNVGVGTDGRPIVGYSNAQSGAKGIEYLTALANLGS